MKRLDNLPSCAYFPVELDCLGSDPPLANWPEQKEDMRATYRDGVLEIHIPKADQAKPKQIAITVN